jgi:hypothetical protein
LILGFFGVLRKLSNLKIFVTIPPEIFVFIEQLTQELNRIEQQANKGFTIANQLLERFPNNDRLISLSANLGNGLFFVARFRNRIENIIGRISETNVTNEAISEAGEELSEIWGRILECKITVSRSVGILENLQ